MATHSSVLAWSIPGTGEPQGSSPSRTLPHGNSAQNTSSQSTEGYGAAWRGGEFRGEWIHVYVCLSPFAVHLERSQHFQLCPTLCDPIDGSPPGPAIPGILQARTLEWVLHYALVSN